MHFHRTIFGTGCSTTDVVTFGGDHPQDTFTLTFTTPISLTGLTNHGITLNWQSDATGTGVFSDNTLLTTALRTGAGVAVAPPALTQGSNLSPGGGYYRNASGLTTFNMQANDARTIANVGGIMFELTAVPEPGSLALFGVFLAGALNRRSSRAVPGRR